MEKFEVKDVLDLDLEIAKLGIDWISPKKLVKKDDLLYNSELLVGRNKTDLQGVIKLFDKWVEEFQLSRWEAFSDEIVEDYDEDFAQWVDKNYTKN